MYCYRLLLGLYTCMSDVSHFVFVIQRCVLFATLATPWAVMRTAACVVKAAFHDADTDILADILTRMPACRATSPFSLPHE